MTSNSSLAGAAIPARADALPRRAVCGPLRLEKLGFTLFAHELLNANNAEQPAILSGLEEFREHLGGELSITLLAGIGRSLEAHEMDPPPMAAAIRELQLRQRSKE